ncbi:MAG: CapA family protein, partial [Endomicrobia bacterium]|nr:CapA family protein [Endomicrobiia bacterium]
MWRCAVSSLYKSVFKLILCSSFYLFPAILLTQQQEVEVLVIKAVGDVMLGSITPKTILPPNYEVFDGIREYLSSADVVLCNLEGMFITKDIKAAKHKLHKPHNYYFGTPVEFAVILKKLNFNVVSLNNNHIMDYGMAAYKLTQQTLTQLGLHCATNQKYATLEIKNTKIAVVAFSFTDTNYSILNISDAKNKITKIKQQHDIVIVSFHGGAEGEEALYVKNSTEYFLGENRGNVVEFAHSVIDAGADLVIGHGPHVLRAVEVYKNKLIAYSLGNFL